ncbi:hypothetical protein QMO14_17065 [Variovorax sp. CAN2819]|uniref:surface-adhesin E family protein n=1 Tax=Variovorax sp. CAN15 TaxID=3046727 RepID=UPI00264A3EA9|nr:surface-adhesin E family protein [Variovorax sp. CAN15]MDN6885319.1 hypothetical protein [Variovorax sp. CAN15]
MKTGGYLAMVLTLATAVGAFAQSPWVEFASNDGSTAYFDQTSIRPDLTREVAYFAWWRSDLRSPSVVDGKAYKSHLANYRVDCMRRTLQQQEIFFLSASETQVARDGGSAEALPMADTLGETFVKVVCARAGR